MKKMHILARAVITQNNRILLARQKGNDNTFLPGGHLEIGESLLQTLKRELHEETSLDVNIRNYLGVVEAKWVNGDIEHFEINHLFKCHLQNHKGRGRIISSEQHLKFLWVRMDDLDNHNLLPKSLRSMIKNYRKRQFTWWASELS